VSGLAEMQKAFMGPYVNGHMELKGRFYVPFNPAELSIQEAIGVTDMSGVDGREKQRRMEEGNIVWLQYPEKDSLRWRHSGMTTLSVTLFYNTLYDLYQDSYADVRDEIKKLYPYTNTTEKIEKTDGKGARQIAVTENQAQQIYFFWGSIAVAGTLTQMNVTYTMFAPDGKPVRAQVGISIEGFYVGEETSADNKPSGSSPGGQSANGFGSRENYEKGKNPRL